MGSQAARQPSGRYFAFKTCTISLTYDLKSATTGRLNEPSPCVTSTRLFLTTHPRELLSLEISDFGRRNASEFLQFPLGNSCFFGADKQIHR